MKHYRKLIKELKKADSIAIFIHEYPDGDAIGASSALYFYLKALGKHVELFSKEPVPQNMTWVDCHDVYQEQIAMGKSFNLGLLLDCADMGRPGKTISEQAKCCKTIIRIDHHLAGEVYSKFDVVDTNKSSTCELLTEVLLENKKTLTKEIANSLLFGILTDTNSLQNSNTTKRTVELIAELMEMGADLNKLEEYAFASTSQKEVEVTKEFYKNMVLCPEEKIAYSFVDYKQISKIGATKEDMNGHANILRNINGIDLAFVIYEIRPNYFSCSLRSSGNIACNKIAKYFGGGGHRNASAYKYETENIEELISKTFELCREEMKCQAE